MTILLHMNVLKVYWQQVSIASLQLIKSTLFYMHTVSEYSSKTCSLGQKIDTRVIRINLKVKYKVIPLRLFD